MKKLLITLLLIPLGFSAFGQFLTDWTVGMTPAQVRAAWNGNNTIVEDTVNYFYVVNGINGAAIDTSLARAGRVGNGDVPPYFDGSSDGGNLLYFYGQNGFWTALQGGAPTANRSYRLPIQALPSAGLRAFMVIDQYGNMQFKDSADVGGGSGDLAFADTVSGSGFLETQFRIDTAKSALRGEIAAISTGSGFVELADSVGTAAGTYLTGTGAAFIVSTIGSRLGVTDTSDMLTPYAETGEVRIIASDTARAVFDEILSGGETALAADDTITLVVTVTQLRDSLATVTASGFTPAGGSLTLSGADALTLTTTAATNVTLPTSGTLATTAAIGDSIAANAVTLGDSISLKSVARILVDTTEIFVFGAGGGNIPDTASIQTATNYGGWYHKGRDTIMITEVRTILGDGPGSDTLRYQIWVNDTITTTYASRMFTNADSLGLRGGVNRAFTVGFVRTSFTTTPFKIPPGNHVWMTTPNIVAGRKPTYIRTTISGYYKNGIY